jgi:CheY-like chemotaxis protein
MEKKPMTPTTEGGDSGAARENPEPPRKNSGDASEEDLGRFRGLSYLILDDSRFARALLKNVLHAFGIRSLTECETAAQALQLIRSTKVDIIFADFEMPDMSGAEFAWRLRRSKDEQTRQIPVIMVSVHADDGHVRLAINAGVNEYLAKPFAPSELLLRLRRSVLSPKPFIVAPGYVGPDRRLPDGEARTGVERRGALAPPALLYDCTGPEPKPVEIARARAPEAQKIGASATKPEAKPDAVPSVLSESGLDGLAAAVRERAGKPSAKQ